MGPPSRVGVMIEFGLSKLSFNFDPSFVITTPPNSNRLKSVINHLNLILVLRHKTQHVGGAWLKVGSMEG